MTDKMTDLNLNTPLTYTRERKPEEVHFFVEPEGKAEGLRKGTLADLLHWAEQHPAEARAVMPEVPLGRRYEARLALLVEERDAAVKRAEEAERERDDERNQCATYITRSAGQFRELRSDNLALRARVTELESAPVPDQLARSLGDLTRQLLAALPERRGPATAAELIAELAAERDTLHAKVERLRSQLSGLKCQAKDDARVAASWMREVERMRTCAVEVLKLLSREAGKVAGSDTMQLLDHITEQIQETFFARAAAPKPEQPEADGERCADCDRCHGSGFGESVGVGLTTGVLACESCNGTGKRTPDEPKPADMTDAECDAELRAIGVNPEEVKVRGRVFADTLKENARLRAEVAAKPAATDTGWVCTACGHTLETAKTRPLGPCPACLNGKWQRETTTVEVKQESLPADERLREAVGNLLSVLDENLHRGAGHAHWDYTMSHGAGCATCQAQREGRTAIEKARRAVDAALVDTGGKGGGK